MMYAHRHADILTETCWEGRGNVREEMNNKRSAKISVDLLRVNAGSRVWF